MRKTASLGLLALLAASALGSGQERLRRPPPIEPLVSIRLPELQSRELANGLKLWVAVRENFPIMSLVLSLRGGESASPEKTPGLASLAATLLGQGTVRRRLPQLEEDIEAVGGELGIRATPDAIELRFHFLDERLDDALAIVSEIILEPVWTERAIQIAKTTVTYDLVEKERDPEFAARRHLVRLLFEGHPYGRSAFTREVIRGWTLKDLLEFVGPTLRPNNAHLLLVGNLNINTATRKVSHYLNTWTRHEYAAPPLPALRPPARDRIVLVDVPGMRDCVVYAGTTVPTLTPVESSAFTVLNQILGGSLFSRLIMNLRESKGYARFAYSEFQPFRSGGVFLVRAAVPADVLVPAVVEILDEVRKLAKDPPSPLEVEQAKGYLLANFPVSIERFDQYTDRIGETISLGAGEERWSRFYEAIVGVDLARIYALGQKILGQPFIVVVAGAKEICLPPLAELGPVEVFEAGGRHLSTTTKRKEP